MWSKRCAIKYINVPKGVSGFLFYVSFCFVLLPCVCAANRSTSGHVHGIYPPAILDLKSKIISGAASPPTGCPNTDRDKQKHVSFLLLNSDGNIPEDWTYFCDDQRPSSFLVEGFFPRNICPIGEANYIDFQLDMMMALLKCKKCEANYIQFFPHDSATEYGPGCTVKGVSSYILNNLDKMVQIYDGGATNYSQYVCDVSKGYSERNRITLCNVSNHCDCGNFVTCDQKEFPVLLPDGSCDRSCLEDRVMGYKCPLHERTSAATDVESQGQQLSDEPSSRLVLGPILGVVFGIVVIAFIPFCVWRWHKSKKNNRNDNGSDGHHSDAECNDGNRDSDDNDDRNDKQRKKKKKKKSRKELINKNEINIQLQINSSGQNGFHDNEHTPMINQDNGHVANGPLGNGQMPHEPAANGHVPHEQAANGHVPHEQAANGHIPLNQNIVTYAEVETPIMKNLDFSSPQDSKPYYAMSMIPPEAVC